MSRSLKQAINEANPNTIADAMRELPIGNALANAVQSIKVAVASNVAVLPSNLRASSVISGFATVGAVTGELVPVAKTATLATTQCQGHR